jgi:wyosine [tRNA(Phe)-imidazoG37] synthetase (radical SAM superfamily)
VYPVVSRRSGGISIGINLSPGKECSFDCIYCQVDRRHPAAAEPVNLDRVRAELDGILRDEKSGSLYEVEPFCRLPGEMRGVRDIAFSGDGEPTASSADFYSAVEIAARLRRRFGLTDAKIVLITNGTFLDRPVVRKALTMMDENNGEIWAKLDAGTGEYFRKINRTAIALEKVLDNILQTARERPVVIQSLWMRIDGAAPPWCEIEAFSGRLNDLRDSGAKLKAIHLHTIARRPAEDFVSPLSDEELDNIARTVRSNVNVPVEVFYETGYRRAPEEI